MLRVRVYMQQLDEGFAYFRGWADELIKVAASMVELIAKTLLPGR